MKYFFTELCAILNLQGCKPDQFTIKTGCFSLDLYDIAPAKISLSSPAKSKSNVDSGKSKSKSKSKDKNNIISVKLKRCPKGMVRDKITKECVPKANAKANAKAKPKTKLARCPKGTRRNPKTLLCESKV